MSEYSRIVSFIVALSVNLILFGVVAAAGLSIASRLVKMLAPRARYLAAVAAFLIVAFVPLALTMCSFNQDKKIPAAIVNAMPQQGILPVYPAQRIGEIEQPAALPLSTTWKLDWIEEKSDMLEGFITYAAQTEPARLLPILWLSVAGMFLFREFAGYRRLKKIRRNLNAAGDKLRKKLKCPGDVRLYTSEFESPVTIGLLRPEIIIPRKFSENLSPAAIRSILQHEMDHARWRDPLAGFLLRMVRAVFWMSPALWFFERVVRFEREAAADYAALREFSNSGNMKRDAAEYAELLVKIAKISNSGFRQKYLPAMPFGGSSNLENRVRRLFAGYEKTALMRLVAAALVVLGSFLGAALLPVASQAVGVNQKDLAAKFSNDYFLESVFNLNGRKVFVNSGSEEGRDKTSQPKFDDGATMNGAQPEPTPPPAKSDKQESKNGDEKRNANDNEFPPFPPIAPFPASPLTPPASPAPFARPAPFGPLTPATPLAAPVPFSAPAPLSKPLPAIAPFEPFKPLAPTPTLKPVPALAAGKPETPALAPEAPLPALKPEMPPPANPVPAQTPERTEST